MRAIDAEALRTVMMKAFDCEDATKYGNKSAEQQAHSYSTLMLYEISNIVEDCIDNAPTVKYTFEEAFQKTVCENRLYCPARPQGEWYYNYQNGWHCSICHEPVKDMPTVMGKADFAFCPNCGADMRGDANGG